MESESETSVQLNPFEYLETKKIWNVNDAKSRVIHFKIGEMIALDCQPYSIVEDEGFKNLINYLKPNYPFPSRNYLTERIMPSIYESAWEYVKDVVNKAMHIVITTDIWSSKSKDQFISCTAHGVYENFDQQVVVLHVKPFADNHTAENISEIMKSMVNEFDIPSKKIHAIVHDNAANMIAGMALTEFSSLTCFLHTTQLVISDCIFEQRYINDIIAKLRNLASHFSRSPLAHQKLRDIQKRIKKKELKPMGDVSTRWDSTCLMFDRSLLIKDEISIYLNENANNCSVQLNENEWAMVLKMSKLLKIFRDMTVKMSHKYANSSDIIPQILTFKHYVTSVFMISQLSGLGTILDELKSVMETRYDTYMENPNCILATYLDPRYRNKPFKNEGPESSRNMNSIEKTVIEEFVKYDNERLRREETLVGAARDAPNEDNADTNITDQTQGGLNDADFNMDEWTEANLLGDDVTDAPPHQSGSSSEIVPQQPDTLARLTIVNEISHYNKLPKLDRNEDSFKWWKEHKVPFPSLSVLAAKYLSCPPSSVESERIFSIGGNMYTPHRSRLSADHGEQLIFLIIIFGYCLN